MTELPSHRIEAIVTWLRHHVRPHFMAQISPSDLEALVRDLLFGSHDMWLAAKEGIVTNEEASNFVLAHVDTWVLRQVGESYSSVSGEVIPDPKLAELVELIFGDGAIRPEEY